MIINMTPPKTFNNWLGFERGFWRRQSVQGAYVPKTRVFGTGAEWRLRTKLWNRDLRYFSVGPDESAVILGTETFLNCTIMHRNGTEVM
jgi:hypothetical protein